MQVHRHRSLVFLLILFSSCGPDTPGETVDGASTVSAGFTATTGSDTSALTTSDSLTTSANATTTTSTTGDGSTTTEDAPPVPPPAAPCDRGSLLVQTADYTTPSGLEWCPGDSIHRYAAAACKGGGACQVDNDCGADRACLCLSDFDRWPDETMCIPALCRIDADCPGDQQCGLNPSICGWSITPSLVCRSPADECVGNEECEFWCAFDGNAQHWLCGDYKFCE